MSSKAMMEINGLKCQVNLPEAPEGEGTHSLPPHHRIRVHNVDEYPACPPNWMHGSDKAASFFFPVESGKHLWLDFNANANNRHEIAVVMSVQGINPITGQHTKELKMEQYKDGCECPKHGIALKNDRFCEECNFKWPAQNYMTTTSCPRGHFWIDGWRADGNSIRGFLITAETMKGIASQIIGEERVWAIGIAFFLSKEAKPEPVRRQSVVRSMSFSEDITYGASVSKGGGDYGAMESLSASSLESTESTADSSSRSLRGGMGRARKSGISGQSVRSVEVEKLEIGGGAKINQELAHTDPKDLDFYEDTPAGVLYGNYCTVSDFETIIEAGAKDFTAGGEGFMADLETGNPK